MRSRNWRSAPSTPKPRERKPTDEKVYSDRRPRHRHNARPPSAQSAGEKTGVNSVLGIAPKTEDFIKEAATSDMLEIEAAKIAQQKGNADEKKFAEQMITDHTKTSTELKGLVPADMKVGHADGLDDSSQKKLDKLKRYEAERFCRRSTIRCRSVLTRMRFRCSSAMPRAAKTRS